MSLHDFSNLAVQDIADEAAAMQSGGFFVQGFDNTNATGAGPGQMLSDTAAVGIVKDYPLTTVGVNGTSLANVNNIISAFKMTGINTGKAYSATFYDNTNYTTTLDTIDYTSTSTPFLALIPSADNKAGSVRIRRTR